MRSGAEGRSRPRGSPRPGRLALLGALAFLSGCLTVRDAFAPAPVGLSSGREGWLRYEIRELRFEAPAAWRAAGGVRRISLESPDGLARLEISHPETDFSGEKWCLAAAEEKLRQQEGTLARARRHPTRFAGRSAHALEADQGSWHVWAWVVCDGGVQYRVFFAAATPATREALEAYRSLVQTARIGGEA